MRVELKLNPRANIIINVFAASQEKTHVNFVTDFCQNALDEFISSVEDSKVQEIENLYALLQYTPRFDNVSVSEKIKIERDSEL